MKQPVNGKVAFVTGGSRGIGLAIARALAAQGVQVAVTGKSQSHLSAARPKIEGAGPARVETLVADVRNYAEVERAIAATVSRWSSRGGSPRNARCSSRPARARSDAVVHRPAAAISG